MSKSKSKKEKIYLQPMLPTNYSAKQRAEIRKKETELLKQTIKSNK